MLAVSLLPCWCRQHALIGLLVALLFAPAAAAQAGPENAAVNRSGTTPSAAPDSGTPASGMGHFVPTAVFGEDERRALPPSHAFLRDKIGVLSLGSASVCTAFCVAGDAIATASHCLLGTTQTPPPDLRRMSFSVGGSSVQESRLAGHTRTAIRAQVRSGTDALRVTPPIAAANDWAIVRLEKAVCRAGGLKLTTLPRAGIEARAAQGHVYQVAMHRDYAPGSLVYGGPCTIARAFPQAAEKTIASDFSKPEAILMHTCDTGPGSSGSPLLTDTGQGAEVVGINVGTYVLSRPPANMSSTTAVQTRQSEAIANTAIQADEFRAAIEASAIETSALPGKGRR